MKKYKMKLCGYKNWRWENINGSVWGTIKGEPVEVEYEIEAENYKEAEEKAIKDFESKGYFFDEIDVASINYFDEIGKDDII